MHCDLDKATQKIKIAFLQYLLCDNTDRLQIICRISTGKGFCQQEMENLGLLSTDNFEMWQIIQKTRITSILHPICVLFLVTTALNFKCQLSSDTGYR